MAETNFVVNQSGEGGGVKGWFSSEKYWKYSKNRHNLWDKKQKNYTVLTIQYWSSFDTIFKDGKPNQTNPWQTETNSKFNPNLGFFLFKRAERLGILEWGNEPKFEPLKNYKRLLNGTETERFSKINQKNWTNKKSQKSDPVFFSVFFLTEPNRTFVYFCLKNRT